MKTRTLILAAACMVTMPAWALEGPAPAATSATPAAADSQPQGMQLGKVTVNGQQQRIMAMLRGIKAALHTPFSGDAAHANDVVCTIDKGLGEAREYLTCATNREYTKRKDATQISLLTGTLGFPPGSDEQILWSFIAVQPHQVLHVPVKGAALQALLEKIPDAAPAAATAQAPSPAPTAP